MQKGKGAGWGWNKQKQSKYETKRKLKKRRRRRRRRRRRGGGGGDNHEKVQSTKGNITHAPCRFTFSTAQNGPKCDRNPTAVPRSTHRSLMLWRNQSTSRYSILFGWAESDVTCFHTHTAVGGAVCGEVSYICRWRSVWPHCHNYCWPEAGSRVTTTHGCMKWRHIRSPQ